ncbi:[NiFe]-hydrogenase assembly chaperone HybE [Magnetovirga frankeli]|uniref:[NiFe]-hydrogenase assembly chaperone HybE n=1 Tax=Magnetovirga frankeli TaxID=947516 RepID=UPI001292FD9A|nr:[NiFe]-hydrogenase assembly chaperone HybE [gamma proteobacterium SS-5]
MIQPQQAALRLEQVFTRIALEQMAGLPLLNPALRVEALGFQHYQDGLLGVLITPWMMSLILLPAEEEDWTSRELGDKEPRGFPAGRYKFLLNEVEDLGRYLAHSLYSPMHEFRSQGQARAAAEDFLRGLMTPKTPDQNNAVDEELLGRIMRNEELPEGSVQAVQPETSDQGRRGEQMISRRDLLRGRVRPASEH